MSIVDQDLADLGAAIETDKHTAAQKTLGGDKPAAQPNGFMHWMQKLPQNITVGLMDAALNADELMHSGDEKPEPTPNERRMAPSDAAPPGAALASAVTQQADSGDYLNARPVLVAFRNYLAQGTDGVSDKITQSVAQFAVPYNGFSKAFSGLKAAEAAPKLAQMAGKVGQVAGAESSTMASMFDPHSGRAADLVELGKHTEGKLADALNTIAPDGSALNAYIDYMTDRSDEGEAEGRFKNVVDNLAASAAVAGLIHTGAKTLRGARAFRDSPVVLPEIGSPEHLAAQSQKLAGEALMQFPESPHSAMVQLTEQADNTLDDAEHATIKAARDKVAQGLPEQGITVVPSPEGHTVVVGKQPYMTFVKEEDAVAAVADVQRLLGSNFNARAAAEHAKSSDANFATLHSFSRVLKTNVDRPVSTHSLLSSLERNLKGDTEQGAFYKELLGRLVRKKIAGTTTVSSKGGSSPDVSGHFATAFNAIELYDGAFKDPKRLLHTYVHEAVHAATLHEMNASAGVTRKLESLRKTTQDIFEKQADEKEAATGGREGRPYGFKDAAEFVAEIESNPEFRKLMQKTQVDGGTAWDKYLETIAGILGVGSLVATPAGLKEFSKLMMGPKQEEKPVG